MLFLEILASANMEGFHRVSHIFASYVHAISVLDYYIAQYIVVSRARVIYLIMSTPEA